MTPLNKEQICYIAVTMLEKNGSDHTKGLFFGIKPLITVKSGNTVLNSDDIYVWVYNGGHIHIFNTSAFNISLIEIGYSHNATKTQILPFNNGTQNNAIDILNDISDFFKDKNKIKDNLLDIVNIYHDIPERKKEELGLVVKKESLNETTKTTKTTNVNSTVRSGVAGYTRFESKTYTVKTPETSIITRTTKYDRKKALKAMQQKLKALAENTYKAPVLKTLPVDAQETNNDDITEEDALEIGINAYQNAVL